jgi:hypothetical protein
MTASTDSASGLVELVAVALGSGLTVKVLDILYQEWRHRSAKKQSASDFVEQHLDPLLKSADELVGKLRALAETNFQTLYDVKLDPPRIQNHDFGSLLFLMAQFWAQIETIRHEGMSVAMAKDDRGARVQKFFDCLESRRVRVLERILQRAVGEVSLRSEMRTYSGFIAGFENDAEIRKWLMPLASFLSKLRNTSQRQCLLQYGAVVHAFIDTLDPQHLVTRERPSWPHKLSKMSKADLWYRVFGVYLRFVEHKQKYLGPPVGGPKQKTKATRRDFLESENRVDLKPER